MVTLGIETSCDETSCAILDGRRVLSNNTISSLKKHKRYGGVIPEIAVRMHARVIDSVLQAALHDAGVSIHDIGLIAVTHRPGLSGALAVGVMFAQALAYSLRKPLIGVNHLHAHIFAPFLDNSVPMKFPFLGLVVSGGHTELSVVRDFSRIKMVGATRDDACGEVYDKVARVLGLGYPGGPVIDSLFNPAFQNSFPLRCGRVGLELSFSGIKTGVMYKKIELEKTGLDARTTQKLVSSFQYSVVTALVDAVGEAVKKYALTRVVCGGGVIANTYLRQRLQDLSASGVRVLLPPLSYTTDNAAMVAGLGFYLYNTSGCRQDARRLRIYPN